MKFQVKSRQKNKTQANALLNADQFAKMKQIPLDATSEEADRIARAWYPPYEMAYYLLPNGTKLEAVLIAKNDMALELHSEIFRPYACGWDTSDINSVSST